MKELNCNDLSIVNGGGAAEFACYSGFTALGALGGFIAGGIATAGLGMGPGALWGAGLGSRIGSAVCYP
ncbi:bacteriocin-like peptide [Alteromonas sp. BL110]|uniref:bacteriocin-like peptide n=1 Tax=Alteromonas sp. BL110 TaxID=1714845 RepID=UPI000E47A0BD|nr:bacteriocin-like peptide [Alteromonas sp. BL110]AXT38408.1 bacteriocin-like peptide [Alteromonas sp. BL110]RKM83848.1 bacteriocin-like peptide [Alteromonas sp. BL110]